MAHNWQRASNGIRKLNVTNKHYVMGYYHAKKIENWFRPFQTQNDHLHH